jgi:hypothetical protein
VGRTPDAVAHGAPGLCVAAISFLQVPRHRALDLVVGVGVVPVGVEGGKAVERAK